jgi:hypothetical protein
MAAPSKGEEAKRRIITMRVTNAAYDKIAAAAQENGRSVSQEIESRLELSFQEERIMGGESTALLSKLIASTIGLIELETERNWTKDRMTWEAVNAAVQRIVSWFQPSLDFDIWDKYRDSALLPFIEAAWAVEERRDRIKGLEQAYPPALMPMPEGVRSEYDKAMAEYPVALDEAKRRAKAVFDGPLKEQRARNAEAVKLGRKIAGERQGERAGSVIVGGIMRMFKVNGAFEPLPGLRDPADVSDEELFDAIRTLAGAPSDDADMTVFRASRTYEDFEGLRAESREGMGDGHDQEA